MYRNYWCALNNDIGNGGIIKIFGVLFMMVVYILLVGCISDSHNTAIHLERRLAILYPSQSQWNFSSQRLYKTLDMHFTLPEHSRFVPLVSWHGTFQRIKSALSLLSTKRATPVRCLCHQQILRVPFQCQSEMAVPSYCDESIRRSLWGIRNAKEMQGCRRKIVNSSWL